MTDTEADRQMAKKNKTDKPLKITVPYKDAIDAFLKTPPEPKKKPKSKKRK